MSGIRDIMLKAPVIPVLMIEDARHAAQIAEALVEGGLPVLEVTLRTLAALDALAAMASVPGAFVGAGTVLNTGSVEVSVRAGARFIVSPGLTENVVEAARAADVPLLPGVATAGDIMRGLDLGLNHFKFFPAEAAGGLRALKALAAPFGGARFCPTGGITAASAAEWLAHPSVLCVGGSWLVPAGTPDLNVVRERARAAAGLARSVA
jgi:2-dehydro-3-deoxyphosphogluconate aldolase/(4S)-4-hydroxy-2-oxoglutarate aldolase